MLEDFLRFWEDNQLSPKRGATLLALSGGVDSMVMSELFLKAELEIGIAHCNFHLRGEESDLDQEFVDQYSLRKSVPFLTKRFDTQKFSEDKGISIQMAARELRYEWFLELLKSDAYGRVAMAHHKDDQLETILFNLAKGTGIAGLTGMAPKSGKVIRPMLFSSREEIVSYANDNAITWREDSSNKSNSYNRNKIRNQLLPVLKEINSGVIDGLDYSITRLNEAKSAVRKEIRKFRKIGVREGDSQTRISKKHLVKTVTPTICLNEVAADFGFTYRQCFDAFKRIDEVGLIYESKSSTMNIDRSDIIITPKFKKDLSWRVIVKKEDKHIATQAGNFSFDRKDKTESAYSSDESVVTIDYDMLQFPIVIRYWTQGDKFIPLGMKGKKKISDLLIDDKIPLILKDRMLVMESGDGKIIWVVGIRLDDRYKITEDTTSVWKVEYGQEI